MGLRQLVDFLTENGDGTGNNDIKQDGSGGVVIRKFTTPVVTSHMKVHAIQIMGVDGAVTDADGSFLNLAPAAALANGLEVGIYLEDDDSQILSLVASNAVKVKNNSDFIGTGWDYEEITFAAGDSIVLVQRNFTVPLIVNAGEYLGVKIFDDLTAFTEAHASFIATAPG